MWDFNGMRKRGFLCRGNWENFQNNRLAEIFEFYEREQAFFVYSQWDN